jgi:hypothetical protein
MMAHWRDGGIGNMPGRDDRPVEEFTLMEKLRSLADATVGGPIPKVVDRPNDWATALKEIANEAFDEIERLRHEVRRMTP